MNCDKVKVGQVWRFTDRYGPYEVVIHAVFNDLRGSTKVVFQRLPEERGPSHPRYRIRQLPHASKLVGACYVTCGGVLTKKRVKHGSVLF